MNLAQLFNFVERLRKQAIGDPKWIAEKKVYEYLYQSSNWVTDNCPVSTRDRHDFPGLVNQRVPGIAAVVDDIVEGFEDAV